MPMYDHDTVVIGSGLSGLICANILAKEGEKVCVLEQHSKPGGCLQTFKRDGKIFDTGIHYVGGLADGQNLNSYFKYLNMMDRLNLRRLDTDAFDKICFYGDKNEYPLAEGYDNFVEHLSRHFPSEKENLHNYISYLKKTVNSFPLYNLSVKKTEFPEEFFYQENASEVIRGIIKNPLLRNIVAGNNLLYAGVESKTPIHIHSLINDNFIKSSWRLVDGGSQMSDILVDNLEKYGCSVKTGAKVIKFAAEKREMKHVELESGEKINAKRFISTIHPANMLEMLDGDTLSPYYKEKIFSLEDTIGVFGLYLTLKKGSFKYINSNYYCYHTDNVWTAGQEQRDGEFNSYMFLTPATSENEEYAESAIALAYMRYGEVSQWRETRCMKRGEEYEEFKRLKAEIFIDQISKRFPDLKGAVDKVYTSTPLTFRDYVSARNGALYGILRNCHEPNNSFISPRTRIKNLYLSGQNIILHGVLGVTISAVLTCGSILGFDYLIKKIRGAS